MSVWPPSELIVSMPRANSCKLVLPMNTAPASRRVRRRAALGRGRATRCRVHCHAIPCRAKQRQLNVDCPRRAAPWLARRRVESRRGGRTREEDARCLVQTTSVAQPYDGIRTPPTRRPPRRSYTTPVAHSDYDRIRTPPHSDYERSRTPPHSDYDRIRTPPAPLPPPRSIAPRRRCAASSARSTASPRRRCSTRWATTSCTTSTARSCPGHGMSCHVMTCHELHNFDGERARVIYVVRCNAVQCNGMAWHSMALALACHVILMSCPVMPHDERWTSCDDMHHAIATQRTWRFTTRGARRRRALRLPYIT